MGSKDMMLWIICIVSMFQMTEISLEQKLAQEQKLAHLGFIQGVINRMGNNSFMIKGWCITLIGAIFALSADKVNAVFVCVVFFPVVMFWGLDAYFLRQERMYRKLYQDVANEILNSEQLSMSIAAYQKEVDTYVKLLFSKTLFLFYSGILSWSLVIVLLEIF